MTISVYVNGVERALLEKVDRDILVTILCADSDCHDIEFPIELTKENIVLLRAIANMMEQILEKQ